ncbi:MAG TPA: xylose isomerase, partial [Ktedonobacteraceae bacterium]|nr:xylose isomerase [Ktedonobacteraceae bacterium]
MTTIPIANAPCSWGALEFEGLQGEQVAYSQMLDELRDTGYAGTELGDWGYMPTEPGALRAELERRGLAMVGAFVPVALKYPGAHAA